MVKWLQMAGWLNHCLTGCCARCCRLYLRHVGSLEALGVVTKLGTCFSAVIINKTVALSRFIKSKVSRLPASQHCECTPPYRESFVSQTTAIMQSPLYVVYCIVLSVRMRPRDAQLCYMQCVCCVSESPWIKPEDWNFSVIPRNSFDHNFKSHEMA
jgi:hypothetical protein